MLNFRSIQPLITILVIPLSLAVMIFFERAQATFPEKEKALPIDHGAQWNALKVKWKFDAKFLVGHSILGFKDVPRTKNDLDSKSSKDWELVNADMDVSCEQRLFPGVRYVKKVKAGKGKKRSNDPSAVIIFDSTDGYIVGIQSWIPKATLQLQTGPEGKEIKARFEPKLGGMDWYVEDGDQWVKTIYFIDPKTICTKPRTEDEFKTHGTGSNGLWIRRNRPNHDHEQYVYIPMDEHKLQVNPQAWAKGKCFNTMGQHYWYKVSSDMNCEDIVPFCLLYNGGILTGMCFVNPVLLNGGYYDSPRPTAKIIGDFVVPLPKCLATSPAYRKLSTVHVYFKQDAIKNAKCPEEKEAEKPHGPHLVGSSHKKAHL